MEKAGIAPTERGVKDLHTLIKAQQQGFRCSVVFVIQMPKVREVRLNVETHPAFDEAMEEAKGAEVKIWYLGCKVLSEELTVDEQRRSSCDTII